MMRTPAFTPRAFFAFAAMTFLMALLLALGSDPAFAQGTGEAGVFSCSNGRAIGTLYRSSFSCPTTLSTGNLFSFLVCNFEQLSSNLMGSMFCGMIHNLTPAVSAVLVLASTIFGIGFTIGVIPATAREFQIFLLKVAFIWAFATQADLLIGYGYSFLINGVRDGVAIALNGIGNITVETDNVPNMYKQFDNIFKYLIDWATSYFGTTNLTNNAETASNICKNAVFAVLAIMAFAAPPIFIIAVMLIFRLAMTLVRAVFSYIYAVVGIAFLLILAPFFLSFYMFRQTRPFFDKWIGYMASFALQIVLLFAFLSFVLSVKPSQFTASFQEIVMENKKAQAKGSALEAGAFRFPWEYCTICDFVVVDRTTKQKLDLKNTKTMFENGELRCQDEKGNPITDAAQNDQKKPMDASMFMSPDTTEEQTTIIRNRQSTLFRFAGTGLLSLLILAYLLEAMVGLSSSLSQILASSLGSAFYAPQLGGGFNPRGLANPDIPMGGSVRDFEAGFEEGLGRGSNSIGSATNAIKDGFERMVIGKGKKNAEGSTVGGENADAGFRRRFVDWLIDPTKMNRS